MSPERQALLDSLLVERFTPWVDLRAELPDSPPEARRHPTAHADDHDEDDR